MWAPELFEELLVSGIFLSAFVKGDEKAWLHVGKDYPVIVTFVQYESTPEAVLSLSLHYQDNADEYKIVRCIIYGDEKSWQLDMYDTIQRTGRVLGIHEVLTHESQLIRDAGKLAFRRHGDEVI